MKRIASLARLAIAVTVTALLGATGAFAQSGNWEGNRSGGAWDPPTTPGLVIDINSEQDLAEFAYKVTNGRNFAGQTVRLTQSMNLSAHYWTPIGNTTSGTSETFCFGGAFDGQGYTVYGMTMDYSDTTYNSVAFFSQLRGAASVKNLRLMNVNVTGSAQVAGLAVRVNASSGNQIVIDNCSIEGGTITSTHSGGMVIYLVGGLVGSDYSSSSSSSILIRNCSNSAAVTSNRDDVGGIISHLRADYGSSIANCLNYGNVSLASVNTGTDIGGIVGLCNTPSATPALRNCLSSGILSLTGQGHLGAIGGYLSGNANNYGFANLFYLNSIGTGNAFGGVNGGNGNNQATSVSGIAPNGSAGLYNPSTGVGALNSWVNNNGGTSVYKPWTVVAGQNNGWPVLDHGFHPYDPNATPSATTYTVTFGNGGGTDGSAMPGPLTYTNGVTHTLPANTFAKTGHSFLCWSNAVTGATYPDQYSTAGGDLGGANDAVTLTAAWKPSDYTVTFQYGNGNPDTTTNVTFGTAYSLYFPTPPMRPNYSFDYWTLGGVDVTSAIVATPSPHTLVAHWTDIGPADQWLHIGRIEVNAASGLVALEWDMETQLLRTDFDRYDIYSTDDLALPFVPWSGTPPLMNREGDDMRAILPADAVSGKRFFKVRAVKD